MIASAVSLGHEASLIVHVGAEGDEAFRKFGHLRLSVGPEDPEDLIADLAQALEAV